MATRRTEERKAAFLEAVGEGLTIVAAAAVAGIDRQTAYNWRDSDSAFSAALRDAEDRARAVLERKVLGADDWRAAITVLERRHRDDWAKNDKVEHSGALEVKVIRE